MSVTRKDAVILGILIIVFFICIGILHFASGTTPKNIAIIFLIIIYIISSKDIVASALKSAKQKDFFNENSLMTIATLAAFAIESYEEAVGVMLFFKSGEFLQELALNNSKKSIEKLLQLAPKIAHLKQDSNIIDVEIEHLKINDIILIKEGEKVPTDGIVLSGECLLDTKMLTGEIIPKRAKIGDKIFGGSINLNGALELKVSAPYCDCSVAKIIALVKESNQTKAKTQKLITKFAKIYTPIVFLFAILTAICPPIFGFGEFSEWIYRALVVLMVSCPCALVISIPLAYFCGIGACSKNFILIKGAVFLEALSSVGLIAFDKTGTLTKGVFKITSIVPQHNFNQDELLQYAFCAENLSNHPIAFAIKNEYLSRNLSHKCEIKNFQSISGLGIKAECNGKKIIIGSDEILHINNISHSCLESSGSVAHISINGIYAGYILVADEIRKEAKNALDSLKKLGVEYMAMLSGDNEKSAKSVAKTLGISEVYANLLPQDKLKIFKKLKNKTNKKSIFIGDGTNDAPSIAQADIGISMGKFGSDVSKESADILITNDSLDSLPRAIKIAKKTKKIIYQNIIFALGVKLIFIILGLFGIASMWEAVFGDVGVALIALFNAMRILKA